MKYKRLPGFRDFYPEQCSERNFIFYTWRKSAHRFAFSEYDGPILEPLELLTEKSGEEIKNQLFHFEDKSGRKITMRPELTPTLARMVASKAVTLKKPIRWFSIGENFRYERPQKGRMRAFYQFNADILGEEGPIAEVELIGLLVDTLTTFGLGQRDFTIRLSDRKLWIVFLEQLGLNKTQQLAVLSVIDKMGSKSHNFTKGSLESIIPGRSSWLEEQIKNIFNIKDLGTISTYFSTIENSVKSSLDCTLTRWRLLIDLLKTARLDEFITIDLSVVRGIDYYTDFVFEAFPTGRCRALAGGGRYDQLVEKLGGTTMPAVGFAMGDITLGEILNQHGLYNKINDKLDTFIVYTGKDTQKAALMVLYNLRRLGVIADMSLRQISLSKQFKQAATSGARFTVIIGQQELAKNVAKIHDMENSMEITIPDYRVVRYIKDILLKIKSSYHQT